MKKINTFIFFGLVFFFPFFSLHAENYSVVPAGFQFTRNLGLGNQGQDVENLQCVLEMTQTTGYFGPITKAAVLAFQNAHAAEILTPSGLTTGTGYFGLATRNYMNVQLHNSTSTNPICPTYTATTPDVPQYIPPQTLPTQPTTPTTPPNTVQCPNGYSCVQTPTQNQNQQGLLPTTPSFGQNGGLSGGSMNGGSSSAEENFYATHGGRNALTEEAWRSGAYEQPGPPQQLTYVNQTNQNPNNADYLPANVNAQPNGSFCTGNVGYTTLVDRSVLSSYLSRGPVTIKDQGQYNCQNDPVVQYMKENVPRIPIFSWATYTSSCRSVQHTQELTGGESEGGGTSLGSRHIGGHAIDFYDAANIDRLAQSKGDDLVAWARCNAPILGLRQIIFNHQFWNSSDGGTTWVGPMNTEAHGIDAHTSHVHLGR